MEDLWKLTQIDYRLPSFVESKAFEEIVRRYHAAEAGTVTVQAKSVENIRAMSALE